MKFIFVVGLTLVLFGLGEQFSVSGKYIRNNASMDEMQSILPLLNGNSRINIVNEITERPIIQIVDDDFETSETFRNGFLFKIAMALFIVFVIVGIIGSCCYELFKHGYIVVKKRDPPKSVTSDVSTISSVSSLISTKTAIPVENTGGKNIIVNIDSKQQKILDQVTKNYKAVPFNDPKLKETAKFISIKSPPKPFVAVAKQSKLVNLKLDPKIVSKDLDDKTSIKAKSQFELKNEIKSQLKSSIKDQKSQIK